MIAPLDTSVHDESGPAALGFPKPRQVNNRKASPASQAAARSFDIA
jgi:hypothetical protein